MSLPTREECCYTSHYCEENVWKLCQRLKQSAPHDLDQFYVIFISNPDQKIPLWKQKAGVEEEDFLVIWDYHVLLIRKSLPSPLVFDLDSVLPFPCLFSRYWRQGIRSDTQLLPQFGRRFRVVAAAEFLQTFASDRSRMRNPLDGSWLQPPPNYPCIRTPHSSNNLDSFICMRNDSCFAVGTIFQSSESLREYFLGHRTGGDDEEVEEDSTDAEQEALPATN